MAKKRQSTGNTFLSNNLPSYKQVKKQRKQAQQQTPKVQPKQAQRVVRGGGSQYSVKNDKYVKQNQQRNNPQNQQAQRAQQTSYLKNSLDRQGQPRASIPETSRLGVVNHGKDKQSTRLSQNYLKNTTQQKSLGNRFLDDKSKIGVDKNNRIDRLTKGAAKQKVGGWLSGVGNDSNIYNETKKDLDDQLRNGKINKKTYDANMKAAMQSDTRMRRLKNWESSNQHKAYQELARKGEKIQTSGDKDIAKGMKGLNHLQKVAAGAYTSSAQMAMDLAFGPGALVSMGVSVYGNTLHSTKQLVDKGVISKKEAEKTAFLQASKEVGTEALGRGVGLAAELKGAGAPTRSLETMKNIGIDRLVSRIKNTTARNIAGSAMKLGSGAAEEAGEELLGGILDAPITNFSYANRLDKDYRSKLQENSNNIAAQRDSLIKQGYTRKQATKLYQNEISSQEFLDNLTDDYIQNGLSKKAARKQASNMQAYLSASLNGNSKQMKAAENKMAAGIKQKFSASDTIDAMLSAGLSAAVTGAAGEVRTNTTGANIKAIYQAQNGVDGAAKAITSLAKGLDDKKMAARASAMYDYIDSGKGVDLSNEQYYTLQSALQAQFTKNAQDAAAATRAGRNSAAKSRYITAATADIDNTGKIRFGTTVNAMDEQGRTIPQFVPGGVTEARADAMRSDLNRLATQQEKQTKEHLSDKDEVIEHIVAIENGYVMPESTEFFTDAFPENRALYEQFTGETLPADNSQMRQYLFNRSAQNYEASARLETIDRIDRDKGQLDSEIANTYGQEGQQTFQKLSNNIGLEDTGKYVAYSSALGQAYDAGLSGASIDSVMKLARDAYGIGEQDITDMYHAGVADKENESIGATVRYDMADRTSIRNSDRDALLAFARAFGRNIVVTDNLTVDKAKDIQSNKALREDYNGPQVDGMFYDNTIYINLAEGNNRPISYTIMHELTHSLKDQFAADYAEFADLFQERYIEKYGEDTFNKAIQDRIDLYKDSGVNLDKEGALEEIICDQMGEVLTDEDFVQNVAENHPDLAHSLLYTIKAMLQKIRNLFAQYEGFPPRYNEALLSQLDLLKDAEKLLMQAMEQANEERVTESDAEARYMSAEQMRGNMPRFSITGDMSDVERYNELKDKSLTVVQASRENLPFTKENFASLQNESKVEAKKAAQNLIRELGIKGQYETAELDFDVELSNGGVRESAQKEMKIDDKDAFINLSTLFYNLQDVMHDAILIDKYSDKAYLERHPDHKPNHNIKWTYVLLSAFAEGIYIIPTKITVFEYKIDSAPKIHLAIAAKKIEKTRVIAEPANKGLRESAVASSFNVKLSQFLPLVKDKALADYIPPQFRESNQQDFALRSPVEETRDLIAVHNATEKNVRGLLGLGGLPMPSIAIIKAAQGHDDFGAYSFVFDKSTIDPATNRNNKVYGSDAFTPVAPHIEYEVKDDKAYKEFQSEISNLNKDLPATNHTLMNIHNYDYFNTLLTTAGGLEGLKENLFNDKEMRNAFLYTEGEYVPRVIEKVEVKSKKAGLYKHLINRVGIPTLEKMYSIDRRSDEAEKYFKILKEAADEYEKPIEPKPLFKYWNLVFLALDYNKNNGVKVKEIENEQAQVDEINKRIDETKYREWLDSLFAKLSIQEGIYNGKDRVTNTGTRTFKQTHWNVTLDNIVKAMKLQKEGETAFGVSFKAISQKKFNSIDEIKSNSGRLKVINEGEYEKLINNLNDRYNNIVSKLIERHHDNDILAKEHVDTNIVDAIRASKSAKDVFNYLKRYEILTEHEAKEIWELAQDYGNLPTGYFEAKPGRAVALSEVKAIIAPDDAPADLIQSLKDTGAEILTYKHDNAEDRTEKLNSLEPLKFAVRSDSDQNDSFPTLDSVIQYANDNDVIIDPITGEAYSEEAIPRVVKIRDEIMEYINSINTDPTKLTHDKILDEKSVKSSIKELISATTNHSESTPGEIREMTKFATDAARKLWNMYKNMGNLEKATSEQLEEFRNYTLSVSHEIIGDINYIVDDQYERYKELKSYLREVPILLPSSWDREIGGIAAFRRKNFGRMRLVSENSQIEGYGIDEIWPDLVEMMYGNMDSMTYKGEDYKHPSEMLREVSDYLDDTYMYRDALMDGARLDIERQFAQDLVDTVVSNGKPWQSFADKKKAFYDERTRQLKERQKEAMREAKSKYQEKLEREKSRHKEQEKKIRQQGRDRLQKEKDRQREKREAQREKKRNYQERMKSWGHIQKNYDYLSKRLLNPKKDEGQNIPENLRVPLAKVLKEFDLQTERSVKLEETKGTSKATAALRELRNEIAKIASEDGTTEFVCHPSLFGTMDRLVASLDGKPLREMDNQDLADIDDMFAQVKHMIAEQNTLFAENKRQAVESAGRQVMDDMRAKEKKYGRGYTYSGAKGLVRHLFNEDMMTPGDFFELMGGELGTMGDHLRESFDDYIRKFKQTADFTTETFSQFMNVKKPGSVLEDWKTDKSAQTFKLDSGEEVTMTVAQMMSLYCMSKREAAMNHIMGSGIVLSEVTPARKINALVGGKQENRVEAVRMSYFDVKKITEALTKEQRQVADKLQGMMTGTLADWGNEISMQLYGIKLFKDDFYFPIKVSNSYLTGKLEDPAGINGSRILSFSFTKPLVEQASNPLIVGDIFDIFTDHANKMALYSSFAASLLDFNRVYNYKHRNEETGLLDGSVKQAIEDAYGKRSITYINNFLDDINGQAANRVDGITQAISVSLNHYKRAAIGINLRVLVQQPTAIMRSLYYLNPKYFTPSCFTHLLKKKQEMHEHCPIAYWKANGNYQTDFTRTLQDQMFNRWSKYDAATMGFYGLADDMTWTVIWGAVKNEIEDKYPNVKVDSEEYWALCNKRATEVFDRTQVVDSVFHRSDAMRSTNGLTKMVSSFMAEPTRTYNMLRSSIVKAHRMSLDGDRSGAINEMTKVITVLILNAATVSATSAVIDALRGKGDDDDDKSFYEKWLLNFWENFAQNANPLLQVVWVKDIATLFIDEWQGNDWGTSNMALEGWYKLAKGFAQVQKVFSGEMGFIEWISGDFGAGLGYVLGVPYYNFIRDAKSLWSMLELPTFASDGTEEESINKPSLLDYERNPIKVQDGSWGDNVLNHFGINLTKEERRQKAYDQELAEIKSKTEGLSGSEKRDKVNSLVMEGYTKYVEDGDTAALKRMRQTIKDAGGSTKDFDEKVGKRVASEYKKTINTNDVGKQEALQDYLLNHGWSQEDISSQIVYYSDTARKFKAAAQMDDEDAMVKALVPLMDAGLTDADAYKLYENRNRGGRRSKGVGESTGKLAVPAYGSITSGFGYRTRPTAGASAYHEGIDIGAPMGSKVDAADGGTIVYAGYSGGYGNQIVVQHSSGMKTYYSHLSNIGVSPGQKVRKGQYIGNVGSTGTSTGPHLDFRVQVNGAFVNPMNYING